MERRSNIDEFNGNWDETVDGHKIEKSPAALSKYLN